MITFDKSEHPQSNRVCMAVIKENLICVLDQLKKSIFIYSWMFPAKLLHTVKYVCCAEFLTRPNVKSFKKKGLHCDVGPKYFIFMTM